MSVSTQRLPSFKAGTYLRGGTRVAVANGVMVAASANVLQGGVLQENTQSGLYGSIVVVGSGAGTVRMIALGSISASALVYSAADGKVTSTAATGSFLVGRALTSAADDEDIEVEYHPSFTAES